VEKITGVSKAALYKIIETGTSPRKITKEKIAHGFGYSLDEFCNSKILIENPTLVPTKKLSSLGTIDIRKTQVLGEKIKFGLQVDIKNNFFSLGTLLFFDYLTPIVGDIVFYKEKLYEVTESNNIIFRFNSILNKDIFIEESVNNVEKILVLIEERVNHK
jgi:hypothetical protein